jgi:hypothetical protein
MANAELSSSLEVEIKVATKLLPSSLGPKLFLKKISPTTLSLGSP